MVLTAGCSGGDVDAVVGSDIPAASGASPSGPATGGTSSAPAGFDPAAPPSPTQSVAPVPDPTAPATVPPVERSDQPRGPRASSPPAAVDEGVRFDDGVRVRVTGTTAGEVVGDGPGVIAGPVTTFAVSLINGSPTRVDLGAVVVTLVYDEPGRLARPSYGVPTQDFAGVAAPGSTRRASYAFAVSDDQLSSYTLYVDLDAQHAPAVFTGPAD